jgi:tetratricopeptide (TPR) repeat protein
MKNDKKTTIEITKATDLFIAGDVIASGELCNRILALDPENSDALHILGMIAHRQGDNNVAIAFITDAIRINPSNPKYFNNAGCVYTALGESEKAIACYLRSNELDPDFVNAPCSWTKPGSVSIRHSNCDPVLLMF